MSALWQGRQLSESGRTADLMPLSWQDSQAGEMGMGMTSVKVKGTSCFTGDWCGFDEFKPINIIIGRNNTGKSQLLTLVQGLCSDDRVRKRAATNLRFVCTLEEQHLLHAFPANHSGHEMRGDYWHDNGAYFV